jgi:prepilin-type N-terminal cleavage/methylation domain-containing protein
MNTTRNRKHTATGFTLVELLVVIAIIALLMGLLFPSISAVKNQANKSRASAALNQLATASRAYNTEYGRWPAPGANSSYLVYVFNGLRDPVTGQDVSRSSAASLLEQNPRKIQFMEFKSKDVSVRSVSGSGAGSSASFGQVAFYDPWGTPYGHCFDNGANGIYRRGPGNTAATTWRDNTAYDNVIEEPFTTSGGQLKINAGYAFFSNGPDTRTGTGPSNPSAGGSSRSTLAYEDDVRSWK